MVMTRSQSAELEQRQKQDQVSQVLREQREQEQEQEEEMATLDSRVLVQEYGGVKYAAPKTFDGVSPQDYPSIASLPLFSMTAVLADAETCFERLTHYAWEGECFVASTSRLWAAGCGIISSLCMIYISIILVLWTRKAPGTYQRWHSARI